MSNDSEPPADEQQGSFPALSLATWIYLAMAIVALLWIGQREQGIAPGLFVELSQVPLDLALGVAVAAVFLVLWELLMRRSGTAQKLAARLADTIHPLDRSQVLVLALISSWTEELFFRGAMQPVAGLWITSAVFALLHSGSGKEMRLWTLSAAVAGLTLGALYQWRGNLLAPILAHGLINGVQLERLRRWQSREELTTEQLP